jgi:hypothetical protein
VGKGTVRSGYGQLDVVVQLRHVLLLAQLDELRVTGGEAGLHVGSGKDPKKYVVRVAPVGIALGWDVEPVGVEVGRVGPVLSVQVPLEPPPRTGFGADHLQKSLRIEEGEADR